MYEKWLLRLFPLQIGGKMRKSPFEKIAPITELLKIFLR